MDFAGSMQTSLFASGLMAVVFTLAAIMVVQGIVPAVQRTQKKPRYGRTTHPTSHAPRRSGR